MGRLLRFLPALLAFAVMGSATGDHVASAAAAYHPHPDVDARQQQSEQKPFHKYEGPAAAGKEKKNPLTAEFGEFVREQLDKWKVPGVAVAVVDGDEVYAEVCLFSFIHLFHLKV